MSAFGGKADMTLCGNPLLRSLLGAKRTCRFALHMSAYDPKRTSAEPQRRQVTTSNCSAYGHSYPASSDGSIHRRASAGVPSGHTNNVAPLHVCHIIAAVGSRRRKREDR